MGAVSPLRRILTDITRIEGVRGALVISKDGFVLDAVIPVGGINQEGIAAMITPLIDSIRKFGDEFKLGDISLITFEYENAIVFGENLGDALLFVIADRGAVIGRIRYEIQRQKDRVKAAL